ncbi:Uma2 family endonuclease [Oscillatoria sp. HE19RPO]|uniref:Uma2 family endonuclease n=1 Tax=Oscillatoria sp. HE19RPO TaxID=2954806 RepID=UPI0020C5714D|nr:Uma2 family endonuclease [Oscillatoria sp. HE19RPO]
MNGETNMVQSQTSEIPIFPPGDLWSEEPPLESYRHLKQLLLLLACLERFWKNRNDFFVAANMSVYYSTRQRKSEEMRGPDFFVVLDTERRERKSWVIWEEEGKYPNFIIEVLSDSTANTDRGLKKQLYQDIWRTPDYFWFDPYTLEFQGFHLMNGEYQAIQANEQGWLWSEQLQLYLGILEEKLRFFTQAGELVLTPEEEADTERARAQEAIAEVDAERQRSAILRKKLQEMGINPDDIT